MEATIIICTSRRLDILKATLDSVCSSAFRHLAVKEILVINNNLDLRVNNEVEHICRKYKIVKCINFQKPGLSRSKNRGIKLAQSPWLIFLDDDVQIDDSFITKAQEIIESKQFDCFGGMYYPWYPEGQPKWLAEDFGKKTPLLDHTGQIDLYKDGFLSGGIMAVRKEAILNIGGFRTDLGMNEGIGYGEENDLQIRLQATGYTIGFAPDWYMHHAVLQHKHKVSWHLKSAYAHGRDGERVYQKQYLFKILYKLLEALLYSFLIKTPLACYKWMFEKEYYWQNVVLFIFRPLFVWNGRLVGYMKLKHSPNNS